MNYNTPKEKTQQQAYTPVARPGSQNILPSKKVEEKN